MLRILASVATGVLAQGLVATAKAQTSPGPAVATTPPAADPTARASSAATMPADASEADIVVIGIRRTIRPLDQKPLVIADTARGLYNQLSGDVGPELAGWMMTHASCGFGVDLTALVGEPVGDDYVALNDNFNGAAVALGGLVGRVS